MRRDGPPVHLDFAAPPHAGRYMALAFWPKPRAGAGLSVPTFEATWRGVVPAEVVPPAVRRCFRQPAGGAVHPLLLHAASMRLMMAVLTEPRFPLPIWRVLQVRFRLVQHHACAAAEPLALHAQVDAARAVPKGVELDVSVRATGARGLALESTTTFFTRGRFGPAENAAAEEQPAPPAEVRDGFVVTRRGALGFGRLTGDYNGVHFFGPYARGFGFAGAFAHPHRALALALDRLDGLDAAAPLRLQAWLKGPVTYGRRCELAWEREEGRWTLAVRLAGDARPALLASVTQPRAVAA